MMINMMKKLGGGALLCAFSFPMAAQGVEGESWGFSQVETSGREKSQVEIPFQKDRQEEKEIISEALRKMREIRSHLSTAENSFFGVFVGFTCADLLTKVGPHYSSNLEFFQKFSNSNSRFRLGIESFLGIYSLYNMHVKYTSAIDETSFLYKVSKDGKDEEISKDLKKIYKKEKEALDTYWNLKKWEYGIKIPLWFIARWLISKSEGFSVLLNRSLTYFIYTKPVLKKMGEALDGIDTLIHKLEAKKSKLEN
jgi:hypothetical protein